MEENIFSDFGNDEDDTFIIIGSNSSSGIKVTTKLKKKLTIEDIESKLPLGTGQFSNKWLNGFRRSYFCNNCKVYKLFLDNESWKHIMESNKCAKCPNMQNVEAIKAALLSGELRLTCPKCNSYKIKKNAKPEYKNYKENLQMYKCLKCGKNIPLEKLFDDELAKEKALEMFYSGSSFYKIGKQVERKADTVKKWIIEWLAENHPQILEAYL